MSAPRVVHRSRRVPAGALVAVAATVLLALGFIGAALVASGDGGPSAAREPQSRGTAPASTTTTTTTEQTSSTETTETTDAVALHNEGYRLSQAGDYAGALPFLRAAVVALNGSGVIDEAYASYNLAFARFATGRCDGVLGLLERSERIQGEREEIDDLRREWERRCTDDGNDEDGEAGRGNGKGKGKDEGKGRED